MYKIFKNGAAALISINDYNVYVHPSRKFGRPNENGGEQYIAPLHEMISLACECRGNPKEMEDKLGLKLGSLGKEPWLAIIYFPNENNIRNSSKSDAGANEKYIPGGKTSGGTTEAVINQISTDSFAMMPSDQAGLLEYTNVRFIKLEKFIYLPETIRKIILEAGHIVDEK